MTAGLSCGDLVFPLVYSPELHFSEFNSAVADMKNSVNVSFIIFIYLKPTHPLNLAVFKCLDLALILANV